MKPVLKKSINQEEEVAVILTRRDILLLNLCLRLVVLNHSKSGTMRFDIQNLRDKFPQDSGERE